MEPFDLFPVQLFLHFDVEKTSSVFLENHEGPLQSWEDLSTDQLYGNIFGDTIIPLLLCSPKCVPGNI